MFYTLLQPEPLLAVLGWMHWLFIIPLCVLSLFLTLLILVQRGRGGGLTGACPGAGAASPLLSRSSACRIRFFSTISAASGSAKVGG